jgi:hypothetical protein
LRNLGPTVRQWQEEWRERLPKNPVANLVLPDTPMQPAGYVVLQHSIRLDRPMLAYDLWMNRIPGIYATAVLGTPGTVERPDEDPQCLGFLKRYGSLMPMAQEARKPIFHLRPADGALGSHATAAREARADFQKVADRIAASTWKPAGPGAKRYRPKP